MDYTQHCNQLDLEIGFNQVNCSLASRLILQRDLDHVGPTYTF